MVPSVGCNVPRHMFFVKPHIGISQGASELLRTWTSSQQLLTDLHILWWHIEGYVSPVLYVCTIWLHFLTHNFPLVLLYYSPSVLPKYIVPPFPIDVVLSLSNLIYFVHSCYLRCSNEYSTSIQLASVPQ